jgi:hypothetical protein
MPIELGDGASVTVAPPEIPTVTIAPPGPATVTVLPVVGPRGAQGLPGTPGGNGFAFTQSTPAAAWIIDHNLGRKVHVTVFDLTETVVFADVQHGSLNQVTISFAGPVAGSAVVS